MSNCKHETNMLTAALCTQSRKACRKFLQSETLLKYENPVSPVYLTLMKYNHTQNFIILNYIALLVRAFAV